MIEYYKKTISENNLNELDDFRVGSLINVTKPTTDELEFLSDKFDLDIELLEEGLDKNELPRFIQENGKSYIYVKTPTYNELEINTLLIVIGKNFFMMLSEVEFPTLKKIIQNKLDITTTQKLKSLIKILSHINDELEQGITKLLKQVQSQKSINNEFKDKDLKLLLHIEDYLNLLVSNYNYTAILYSKLSKRLNFFEDDKKDLEDLVVESEEGLHICRTALKTISNITNYYSISLSSRLNKTIKLLTILTIAINIPAVIGSIYGMNVNLPMQNNPFAFYYILLIIIGFVIFFLLFIRKK